MVSHPSAIKLRKDGAPNIHAAESIGPNAAFRPGPSPQTAKRQAGCPRSRFGTWETTNPYAEARLPHRRWLRRLLHPQTHAQPDDGEHIQAKIHPYSGSFDVASGHC